MKTFHSIDRLTPRALVAAGLALAAVACDVEVDEDYAQTDGYAQTDDYGETDGPGEADDVEFRIVDPTPVPADELLGMVRITADGKSCSGMLIADDTVLSAAHCFCGDDLVGSNDCVSSATVTFRDDPATAGFFEPTRSGSVTVHPSYNPSWTDNQFENDIAIVTLTTNAPAHATPFDVATTNPSSGATVKIAGFGKTGSGCGGASGTLNFDIVQISGYEDSGKIMRFNDLVFCSGDSGGAIMNTAGTKLYGVHSSHNWTLTHGWVNKSMAAAKYHAWIEDNTCSSSFWDVCDGKGPICECGEGGADCDSDADCRGSLVCTHDVGDVFGLPSTADVCLEPGGPIEGTCGCTNSGLGNLCIATYNNCTPGFSAVCSPASGSCGGCSCQ